MVTDGNLKTRRYFGSDGRELRDVDLHPKVHMIVIGIKKKHHENDGGKDGRRVEIYF